MIKRMHPVSMTVVLRMREIWLPIPTVRETMPNLSLNLIKLAAVIGSIYRFMFALPRPLATHGYNVPLAQLPFTEIPTIHFYIIYNYARQYTRTGI